MRSRTVVVANRLPERMVEGQWQTSTGGLVTAVAPLLREGNGIWIGWTGVAGDRTAPFTHDGIHQVPVPLDAAEVDEHYLGFSNATIWPLYHDAIRTPEFHRTWWRAYQRVNRRFAEVAAGFATPGDFVWVHDYHLQLVPQMLRDLVPAARIAYYLHIPFPPVEIYARNPWRAQLVAGLLAANLVGFQTDLAAHNFRVAASTFARGEIDGEWIRHPGGRTRVITAPISIDVDGFEGIASSPETAAQAADLREQLGSPKDVILGVDRLDYTKGIDVRLRAFETFLEQHPERAADVSFVQVAVPSRETLSDYEDMRELIEQAVGRINGVHGGHHRMPVHYIYGEVPRELLVAYYVAADVMCVTPLRDGMNLVAKEYVVSRPQDDGVLVLSEFAGVANELDRAVLVNPYDIDGIVTALQTALEMPQAERRERMKAMKDQVRTHDVHAWAARVIDAMPEAP